MTFRICLLYSLIFLSGFAGLGYEMVWTRMLAVGLGHEIAAVLAVVAAFFCGLALGAYSLDGMVSRSRFPGRWFAALEASIGVWSVVLIVLIPWFNKTIPSFIGIETSPLHHWMAAFVLPLILLLPATFAMGGTLPAMERLFSRLRKDGWSVGGLYAANTFGAVGGTVVTTFLMLPFWGYSVTLEVLAMVNGVGALGVLWGTAGKEVKLPPVAAPAGEKPPFVGLCTILFFTGLLGVGYEVVVIRILSQVLENTVYSFASVLSVYLLGNGLGAALYQVFAPRNEFSRVLTYLLQAVATACLLGVIVFWKIPSIYQGTIALVGGGLVGSLCGELAVAFVVFFLPTVFMGAVFSHLAQAARGERGGLGRALCLNTLGASLAPLLFGVIFLPLAGSKITLTLVSVAYIIPAFAGTSLRRACPALIPAVIAGSLLMNSEQFIFFDGSSGDVVVDHVEGIMAAVTVAKDNHDDFHLLVNNHFIMGGTSSHFSDTRQAHIPLLLHPDPKEALFLGLGTGATFAAAADYSGLKADGVELIPEVVSALPYFKKTIGDLSKCNDLHIYAADARRFVTVSKKKYDVVIADLFHPARDGAGSLYTVEHFQAIHDLLNPGGLFCQWLPLYQIDLDMLKVIIRSFFHVFPEGSAYLATYSLETPILGLIAHPGQPNYPYNWFERRIRRGASQRELRAVRITSPYTFFGTFVADRKNLLTFAGNGPLNTDNFPVVTFEAPRFVYTTPTPPYKRLLTILDNVTPQSKDVFQPATNDAELEMQARLASYWKARNAFLRAGVGITATNDVTLLLEKVREPLLSIVRTSPDFEAAYNPLLSMAYRLQKIDPQASRQLLLQLDNANPSRPEARALLKSLPRS